MAEMLFDKIRRCGGHFPESGVDFPLDHIESRVFEITNVARYFTSAKPNPLTDLCDVLPPFEQFWMEFDCSGILHPSVSKCAMLWQTFRFVEQGWECRAQVFVIDIDGRIDATPFFVDFCLSEDGRYCPGTAGIEPHPNCTQSGEKLAEEYHPLIVLTMGVCFQALAFMNMNTKSVQIVDNPPSRQVRRHAERKGVKQPVTFKTILIRGTQNRVRPHERGDGTGKFAMHIVRGHRIRGTEERPLFGKPWGVGTFWVESHTRGKAEHGTIINTYKVEVPQAEASS